MLVIRGEVGAGSYKSSPADSNEQSELKNTTLEAEAAAGIGWSVAGIPGQMEEVRWSQEGGAPGL